MIYENKNFLILTSKKVIRNPEVPELVIYDPGKFLERYLYFPSCTGYSPAALVALITIADGTLQNVTYMIYVSVRVK